MEIPKVTENEPYIEFRYTKNGELKLTKTSSWWGGIDNRFTSSNGDGNTCLPKDLNKYIKHFNKKRVDDIKKEIEQLKEELRKAILETQRRVNEV